MVAVHAVKLDVGVVDLVQQTQMLAIMLVLQPRDMAPMSVSQVLDLLLMNATDILREELGKRSARGELRKKRAHYCDEDCDYKRDLAVTDELRLE